MANALGQAPAVAWQTTLSDYLLLQKHWAEHPPIHLVAAAFVKTEGKQKPTEKPKPKKVSSQEAQAQAQQMAMEQGLGVQRAAESVPGHKRFAEKLQEVGDPAKMEEALRESFERVQRNEILKMREEMKKQREAQAAIARGRPSW